MIGILDYGMGNLRSVQKALEHVGHDAAIVGDGAAVRDAERLILPGVGNFADGVRQLRERGLFEAVRAFAASGRPMLGVCLGMQLMFESSTEDAPPEGETPEGETPEGETPGLGLIAGKVVRFREDRGAGRPRLKVPHMGWNSLDFTAAGAALGAGLPADATEGPQVYFVHGYYCVPADKADVAATTEYGDTFCSAVHRGNLWATQFHPEKSQAVGLKLLDNFARWSA